MRHCGKGVASITGNVELNPGPSRRIAGGEFVPGLVEEADLHPGESVVQDDCGSEVEGLLLEHGQCPVDGAVELGFAR